MLKVAMHWQGFQMFTNAVSVLVGSIHAAHAQQTGPVGPQRLECSVRVDRIEVLGDHRPNGRLRNRLRARRIELPFHRIFVISKQENDLVAFTGLKRHFDVVRTDRRPTVRDRI